MAALKATEGPDLIIQGSSTIYPALLADGLIDSLITMTYPVTLGRGKRLFGAGTPVQHLRMLDHSVTPRGTIIATWQPGGALPPMPAEAPAQATSAREAQRQQQIREGTW